MSPLPGIRRKDGFGLTSKPTVKCSVNHAATSPAVTLRMHPSVLGPTCLCLNHELRIFCFLVVLTNCSPDSVNTNDYINTPIWHRCRSIGAAIRRDRGSLFDSGLANGVSVLCTAVLIESAMTVIASLTASGAVSGTHIV